MRLTRRALLGVLAGVTASPLTGSERSAAPAQDAPRLRYQPARIDLAAVAAGLREKFPDLRQRFVFEYYPWYATDPWQHWNEAGRIPPGEIAATAVPALGAYDSRSVRVIEQHARWIRESGVGAINISWWGATGPSRTTDTIMDVMHDHDIKVTFHLEPYDVTRTDRYADDIRYLLDQYGEKRRWDALLLLRDERDREMPVFKSFSTIKPRTTVNCLGVRRPEPFYVPDSRWRYQTDRVRDIVRHDFDRILLLCDSTNLARVEASGFDGVVPFSSRLSMETRSEIAAACQQRDLLFSFNINAGFDKVVAREQPSGPCPQPSTVGPTIEQPIEWSDRSDRARAERLGMSQIQASLANTLDLQTRPDLPNGRGRFFLAYINSFNEWHAGTAFEPAKDYDDLTPVERHLKYHNPTNGRYRLDYLTRMLDEVIG